MAKADDALFGEGLLGDTLAPKRGGNLSERFMIPPFSVLSARDGYWQERKRAWLALGIKSEEGRGANLLEQSEQQMRQMSGGSAYVDENGKRQKNKANATPGGSLMPAMNYKTGQRGDGKGRAVPTQRQAHAQAPEQAPSRPKSAPPDPFAALPPLPLVSFKAAPQAAPQAAAESAWLAPQTLPDLRGVKLLSIDVETRDHELSSKGPGVRRGAHIVGVALGFDGERLYYPLRHEGGGNIDNDWFWRWARGELAAYAGELVGANLGYDLDFLAEAGVAFPNATAFHDVLVAEPLLDEWRMSYSLDSISSSYLGRGKDQALLTAAAKAYGFGNTEKSIKENLWKLPAKFVGPYAEGDVDRPLLILPKQLERIDAEGLRKVYDVERKLVPILVDARRRGVAVDLAKAEEVRARLDAERGEVLAAFRRFAGPQAELMAPDSFSQAFIDKGLSIPLTEKTRKPSIAKSFFARYANDPDVALLARGRKINTIINTFLDGHILGHHTAGRIHCQFNQMKGEDGGTIARFSSSNPNLQNIPARDEEMGPLMRQIFKPDEGCDWQRDDYSQIEYRLLVNYAVGPGAEEARAKYCNDPKTDFHKFVASLAGIDPNDEKRRKWVKGLNFAKGYGAQAPKIAAMLDVTLDEAKEFIALYERKLPFTVATFNKAQEWAARRGYIETVLGRKQRFPLWEPKRNFGKDRRPALPREQAEKAYGKDIQRADTYKALNRKMQGSAADVMKKAMVDAHEAGLFAADALGPFHITVHDELGTSVPRTAAGDAAGKELTLVMEKAIEFRVPILVESARGKNWGETS